MGKGDRKTRRGKIYRSSYGNTRAHSTTPTVVGSKSGAIKPLATKKTATKTAAKKKSA